MRRDLLEPQLAGQVAERHCKRQAVTAAAKFRADLLRADSGRSLDRCQCAFLQEQGLELRKARQAAAQKRRKIPGARKCILPRCLGIATAGCDQSFLRNVPVTETSWFWLVFPANGYASSIDGGDGTELGS